MSNDPYFTPNMDGYEGYEKEVTATVHGLMDVVPFDDADDSDVWDATVQQVLYWHPEANAFDDDYYPCSMFVQMAVEAY